jgi:hypothetical protein
LKRESVKHVRTRHPGATLTTKPGFASIYDINCLDTSFQDCSLPWIQSREIHTTKLIDNGLRRSSRNVRQKSSLTRAPAPTVNNVLFTRQTGVNASRAP